MPHACTEDQLVEQPAIGLFAKLGWQTVVAVEGVFGVGGTLGQETSAEVPGRWKAKAGPVSGKSPLRASAFVGVRRDKPARQASQKMDENGPPIYRWVPVEVGGQSRQGRKKYICTQRPFPLVCRP